MNNEGENKYQKSIDNKKKKNKVAMSVGIGIISLLVIVSVFVGFILIKKYYSDLNKVESIFCWNES